MERAERPLHLVVVFADGVLGMDFRNVARVEVADGDLILTSTRGRVISIPAGEWDAYGPVSDDGDAFTITHHADGARSR